MSRTTTRILLGLALGLAFVVVAAVLFRPSSDMAPVGIAMAGALAVATAVISAWGAQRVVELEEDRRKPYPYPSFDLASRYGMVLFRLENSGGSAAHDIAIHWDGEPLRSGGIEVRLSAPDSDVQVPVLLPGQSIPKVVNDHVEFFEDEQDRRYSGCIAFKDSIGREFSHRFELDAEMYRGTPLHSDEALKTHYELQNLPRKLDGIERELKAIRRHAEKSDKGGKYNNARCR